MTTDHTPSRNCYLQGCRQPECILAATRYTKRLRLEHARGQYRTIDATQTRHHIERLMAAGWTQRQIAHASGIEAASIHQIYAGNQERTATWRAAAILNMPLTAPPADTRRVDATGTCRRLRALRVIGHRRYDLAAALDITPDRVKHITNGHTKYVTPDEAATVTRLYRRLSTIPGPSQQTATLARNKGWHGPLAWDNIDDPTCEPEIDQYSRARSGSRIAVADVARVAELTTAGRTARQIADELGCHRRTVTRARRRAAMQQQAAA